MFPALSAHQDDVATIKRLVRKMLINSSAIVFFLMALLVVSAKPLTILLLTEKWLPSVPFLQLVCITVSFYPIHAINAAALTSVGRSDLYLKITFINKALSILIILFAIPFGIMPMVIAGSISSFLTTFISAWPTKKAINYSGLQQWFDVLPTMILVAFSVSVTIPLLSLNLSNWLTLFLQFFISSIVFIAGSHFLKLEFLVDLTKIIFSKKSFK